MRAALLLAGLLFSGLTGAAPSATAQQTLAAQQSPPQAGTESCQARKPLGVTRTIEIDTARGPRFGHQQYKELSILADGEVILTFDDGPLRPYTRPVLEALTAHCTRATFFMVGRMAVADPEMVREVARRGHTIGTHTWSHQNLRQIGAANARTEIELGISAVHRAAGGPIAPFFRFPFLSDPMHGQTLLHARNIGMFSIEVDAVDYRTKSPEVVHRNVMSQLLEQKKGILLFHDIQPSTAGALRGLLDELAAKGFRVVHMVPKNQVTTLAEFDALADKELSRRKVAIANQPLSPRAMTWPVAPPQAPSSVVRAPRFPPAPGSSPPTDLPPVAAPPPVERPARERPATEPSWRTRVFEH